MNRPDLPREILTAPPLLTEGDDRTHASAHAHLDGQELQRGLMSATAKRPLTPVEKKQARFHIRRYLERCEAHASIWHYLQRRRMESLGDNPDLGGESDCSENATAAFYWAKIKTGLPIEDPNGLGFNGYGYTGTLLAANAGRKVPLDRVFFIGDLALYDGHVTTCRKGGKAAVAVFTSNGSEAGPFPTRLHYRSDLIGVYRPWSLR